MKIDSQAGFNMDYYNNLIRQVKSYLLVAVLFLFPLFFLPFTQEFFNTNKLYLLSVAALFLIVLTTLEIILTKHIRFPNNPVEILKLFFVLSIGLSILLASPNKLQALLNQNMGFVGLASLAILTFYLRKSDIVIMKILSFSSLFLSLTAIFFFFQPFQKTNLPEYLEFLKNAHFSLLGRQLDLAIFLGFMVIVQSIQIFLSGDFFEEIKHQVYFQLVVLGLNIVALSLTIHSLLQGGMDPMSPFRYAWYSAIEILKNPISAFFGVGIDNYASVFSKIKDTAYNSSSFWQIQSFNVGRSTILNVFTEAGVFGFGFLLLIILTTFKAVLREPKIALLPIVYIILVLILFPPSFTVFLLFFLTLTIIDEQQKHKRNLLDLNLGNYQILYIVLPVIIFVLITIAGFFLGKTYIAEVQFKQAIDALARNDSKELYEKQRQAIITNPFIERYRINFSQTNLLIANTYAQKISQQKDPSPQDRQTITQAIQAAIEEAKSAVSLNPQKPSNWENLAMIYRNLLNMAQGSDAWAVSSYQRAILLDPQNPQYRLSLGGVYYSLGNYDDALRFFEQAAALKPDWSNAHYNFAWALYQKGNYQRAVEEMQSVLLLLQENRKTEDYKRAQEDLKAFKVRLSSTQTQDSAQTTQDPLSPATSEGKLKELEPPLVLPSTSESGFDLPQ